MSYYKPPTGPVSVRSFFRTARGSSSILIALFIISLLLYTFYGHSAPETKSEASVLSYKPESPLHSGLSDPEYAPYPVRPHAAWSGDEVAEKVSELKKIDEGDSSQDDSTDHAEDDTNDEDFKKDYLDDIRLEEDDRERQKDDADDKKAKEGAGDQEKDGSGYDELKQEDENHHEVDSSDGDSKQENKSGEEKSTEKGKDVEEDDSADKESKKEDNDVPGDKFDDEEWKMTDGDKHKNGTYNWNSTKASTPSDSKSNHDEVTSNSMKIVQEEDESGSRDQSDEEPQYTTTIVVGRVDDAPEGVDWIQDQLKDITKSAIYIVDDPEAPLHLNRNKGRESMVYMKYIMEHYNKLSDVTVFFHSSRMAWHNNMLHYKDGAVMVNNLQRGHVMDVGYFNMRCELQPGCPRWVKWNATKEENNEHPERYSDLFTAQVWDEIFPNRTHDPVYLAQPCCSQFALSRAKITSIPLEQYVRIHDFLARSRTGDAYLGRIMEYVWQVLFLDVDEWCPSMEECYCKGYGQCLPTDSAEQLVEYNRQRMMEEDNLTKLGQWDRENCRMEDEDQEEEEKKQALKACKKSNPFNAPLRAARKEAGSLMDKLRGEYGISQP